MTDTNKEEDNKSGASKKPVLRVNKAIAKDLPAKGGEQIKGGIPPKLEPGRFRPRP